MREMEAGVGVSRAAWEEATAAPAPSLIKSIILNMEVLDAFSWREGGVKIKHLSLFVSAL